MSNLAHGQSRVLSLGGAARLGRAQKPGGCCAPSLINTAVQDFGTKSQQHLKANPPCFLQERSRSAICRPCLGPGLLGCRF